jgi:hypothetical protein
MGDVWLQIKDRPDLSVCVLKGLIRHSTPKKEQSITIPESKHPAFKKNITRMSSTYVTFARLDKGKIVFDKDFPEGHKAFCTTYLTS